jgi:hypothetical protein
MLKEMGEGGYDRLRQSNHIVEAYLCFSVIAMPVSRATCPPR